MPGEMDELQRLHRMRYSLYLYLSRAFVRVPDGALLALACDSTIAELCRAFCAEAVELQDIVTREASNPDVQARLAEEFSATFLGPGEPLVALWESSYVDSVGLPPLCETYRAAGYQAQGYPHDADDHIATELCFMAALAEDAATACLRHDETERLRLEAIQRDFLDAHLNRWICAFADAVEHVEGISSFYPAFARFAALLCVRDPLLAC